MTKPNSMMVFTLNNTHPYGTGFYARSITDSAAYGQTPTGKQLLCIMNHYRSLGYDAIAIGNGSMDALTYTDTHSTGVYDNAKHKYV